MQTVRDAFLVVAAIRPRNRSAGYDRSWNVTMVMGDPGGPLGPSKR